MTSPVVARLSRVAASARVVATLAVSAALLASTPSAFAQNGRRAPRQKLDTELARRSSFATASRRSRVVVTMAEGQALPPALRQYQKGERLALINGYVLDVPDTALSQVAGQSAVTGAHVDRPIWATDYYSTRATAAHVAQRSLGYGGAGVGVAVIDSGITEWHDDLQAEGQRSRGLMRNQRVARFVDFVNGRTQPYDDHGHGSHVSGIILGNGFDSSGWPRTRRSCR